MDGRFCLCPRIECQAVVFRTEKLHGTEAFALVEGCGTPLPLGPGGWHFSPGNLTDFDTFYAPSVFSSLFILCISMSFLCSALIWYSQRIQCRWICLRVVVFISNFMCLHMFLVYGLVSFFSCVFINACVFVVCVFHTLCVSLCFWNCVGVSATTAVWSLDCLGWIALQQACLHACMPAGDILHAVSPAIDFPAVKYAYGVTLSSSMSVRLLCLLSAKLCFALTKPPVHHLCVSHFLWMCVCCSLCVCVCDFLWMCVCVAISVYVCISVCGCVYVLQFVCVCVYVRATVCLYMFVTLCYICVAFCACVCMCDSLCMCKSLCSLFTCVQVFVWQFGFSCYNMHSCMYTFIILNLCYQTYG